MINSFTLNASDLWDEIEPEISKLRHEKWIDPIIVDKFEALLNNYNGNIASEGTTSVLGKLESLCTMLSMESYYRARNINNTEKRQLVKLNENLILLKDVLLIELKKEEIEDKKAVLNRGAELKQRNEGRLPSDAAFYKEQLNKEYKNNGKGNAK